MPHAPISRTVWPYLWRTWKGWDHVPQGLVGGVAVSMLLYAPLLLLVLVKAVLLAAVVFGLIDLGLWQRSVRRARRAAAEAKRQHELYLVEHEKRQKEDEEKRARRAALLKPPTPEEEMAHVNQQYRYRVALIEASALPDEDKAALINEQKDWLERKLRGICW